jgi:hypothetical protein
MSWLEFRAQGDSISSSLRNRDLIHDRQNTYDFLARYTIGWNESSRPKAFTEPLVKPCRYCGACIRSAGACVKYDRQVEIGGSGPSLSLVRPACPHYLRG